jgi:hypothetical protein
LIPASGSVSFMRNSYSIVTVALRAL